MWKSVKCNPDPLRHLATGGCVYIPTSVSNEYLTVSMNYGRKKKGKAISFCYKYTKDLNVLFVSITILHVHSMRHRFSQTRKYFIFKNKSEGRYLDVAKLPKCASFLHMIAYNQLLVATFSYCIGHDPDSLHIIRQCDDCNELPYLLKQLRSICTVSQLKL